MANSIPVTMTRSEWMEVFADTDNHALKAAVVAAQRGEPLADLLFDGWDDCWPVIDRELNLTGEFRDSGSDDWLNYDDEAAILREEAVAGGWSVDEDEGRAYPPAERPAP